MLAGVIGGERGRGLLTVIITRHTVPLPLSPTGGHSIDRVSKLMHSNLASVKYVLQGSELGEG